MVYCAKTRKLHQTHQLFIITFKLTYIISWQLKWSEKQYSKGGWVKIIDIFALRVFGSLSSLNRSYSNQRVVKITVNNNVGCLHIKMYFSFNRWNNEITWNYMMSICDSETHVGDAYKKVCPRELSGDS